MEFPFYLGFFTHFFVLAIIGKMLGPFFLKESIQSRVAIGIAMVPRGEIGLIFAELGRISGILNNENHAGMIIVIILTTLMSPFAIKWYHGKYGAYMYNDKS